MTGTSAKIIPLPLTQLKCRALLKGPIFALRCDRMECKDTAVTLQGRQGQKNAPINKWTQQALVLPWIPSFFSEGVPCWAAWCERLIQFLAVKKSQILTYFTLSADAALLVGFYRHWQFLQRGLGVVHTSSLSSNYSTNLAQIFCKSHPGMVVTICRQVLLSQGRQLFAQKWTHSNS